MLTKFETKSNRVKGLRWGLHERFYIKLVSCECVSLLDVKTKTLHISTNRCDATVAALLSFEFRLVRRTAV